MGCLKKFEYSIFCISASEHMIMYYQALWLTVMQVPRGINGMTVYQYALHALSHNSVTCVLSLCNSGDWAYCNIAAYDPQNSCLWMFNAHCKWQTQPKHKGVHFTRSLKSFLSAAQASTVHNPQQRHLLLINQVLLLSRHIENLIWMAAFTVIVVAIYPASKDLSTYSIML